MVTEKRTAPSVYIIAGPNGAGKTTFASDNSRDYPRAVASETAGKLTVFGRQIFASLPAKEND